MTSDPLDINLGETYQMSLSAEVSNECAFGVIADFEKYLEKEPKDKIATFLLNEAKYIIQHINDGHTWTTLKEFHMVAGEILLMNKILNILEASEK